MAVTLEPSDVPGALLEEPYEAHAMPALRWWLLCRVRIKVPVSWKKKQLIMKYCGGKHEQSQEVKCIKLWY